MATTFTSVLREGQFLAEEPVPGADFIPDSGNLFPKWPEKLSPTAVEVWVFDAVAEDGSAAFTVSFFHDALAAPASFRVAINAIWADGSIWGQHLVTPMSSITSEGPDPGHGGVVGVWGTEKTQDTDAHATATFKITADLSTAIVTFNAPGKIIGTLTQKSLGYLSLPKTTREAQMSPGAYWMRPIAMADATLGITFYTDNPEQPGETTTKHMRIGPEQRGFGGMDRSWVPMPWTKTITDTLFLRAKVGPYVLAIMRLVGNTQRNYELTATAVLYRDGERVCAPLRAVPPDRRDTATAPADSSSPGIRSDAVRIEKLYDGGGLPAKFRNKNVGYRLDFRSGGPESQSWSFELRHHQAWWSKPTSQPGPDGTGNSGFVLAATGGLNLKGSEESFQGWGILGQVDMPD